jgi:hypothetical protein
MRSVGGLVGGLDLKRVFFAVTYSIVLSLLGETALAQGTTPTDQTQSDLVNLFAWYAAEPRDWNTGILFAVLGFFGALTTAYGLIGGVFPGTEGKARIERATQHLEELRGLLDGWFKSPLAPSDPKTDPRIQELRQALESEERTLTRERWRQFAIATPLYALLGAFFASALAQDLLQAVVIGAGWTTVIGTLGLKKEYAGAEQQSRELTHLFQRRELDIGLSLATTRSGIQEAQSLIQDATADGELGAAQFGEMRASAQRVIEELRRLEELLERLDEYVSVAKPT